MFSRAAPKEMWNRAHQIVTLVKRAMSGRFSVEDVDSDARVVWESSFVALDPASAGKLVRMREPFLHQVLDNLKDLVEQR